MKGKKAWFFFIALTFVIAFFEVGFLHNFHDIAGAASVEANFENMPLLLFMITLTYVPCFIVANAGFNPLWGFVSPFLLSGLFWYLLIMRLQNFNISIDMIIKRLLPMSAAFSIISGLMGVVISFLMIRLFKRIMVLREAHNSNMPETPDENKNDSE